MGESQGSGVTEVRDELHQDWLPDSQGSDCNTVSGPSSLTAGEASASASVRTGSVSNDR